MKQDRSAEYGKVVPDTRTPATAAYWDRVFKEAHGIVALLDEQLRADPPVTETDTHTARRIERCARGFVDLRNKRKPELWT